ncbi:hypothetical protein DEO72_LG5g1651 [Vigna unguiculata]|uniref:Uncharacterized protein n=1 Tax=Vigna unguiculata TaxID=3917 RepID=A0A4D6M017_VIGUN|nr:hypothetical protein DEO72_LG5g1651 [Vigna unguiculata]
MHEEDEAAVDCARERTSGHERKNHSGASHAVVTCVHRQSANDLPPSSSCRHQFSWLPHDSPRRLTIQPRRRTFTFIVASSCQLLSLSCYHRFILVIAP